MRIPVLSRNPDPELPGPRDRDGLLCNVRAASDMNRYMTRWTYEERRRKHDEHAGVIRAFLGHAQRVEKGDDPKTPGAKWFTTKYAVKWAESKGWTVLARETYNHRLKRLNDLLLASDVLAVAPGDGLILIQGAGKSEVLRHRESFNARGGEEKARALGLKFVYVVFERDKPEPILEDWWVK